MLIVTGSVPTNENGIYTMIGGRTARQLLEETAKDAAAVIAVGACAHWGSVQAANPNPTGAVGVSDIIKDKPVLNIAGCPPIADVITATVVHFLTFGRLPETDADGRPLFAYGKRIHDQCSRRAHYDAGQFVRTFDDAGAREGWCLYEVGCKGPATFSPCPIFMWNSHTDWPIGAGHPVPRLHRAQLLGHDVAVLQPPAQRGRRRRGTHRRHPRRCPRGRRGSGRRRARGRDGHLSASLAARRLGRRHQSPSETGREDSHGEN